MIVINYLSKWQVCLSVGPTVNSLNSSVSQGVMLERTVLRASLVSLMHQISTRKIKKIDHMASEVDVTWKLLSIFSPAHLSWWVLSYVLHEKQLIPSLTSPCGLPEALVVRSNTDLSVPLCQTMQNIKRKGNPDNWPYFNTE